MVQANVKTIDAKKFLLERRLIEIRKFLREAQSMLVDFPDLSWANDLRKWMDEHRIEETKVRADLKAHLEVRKTSID